MTDDLATSAPAERPRAHPPETTEGWYAFHQILAFDRAALRRIAPDDRARIPADATARGGAVGDATHRAAMDARVDAERASPHVQRRLFPTLPPEMPYVCFYPMSKRRVPGQNWYALPLDERSRLMMAHGMTGRGYAGRVVQVITGALGLDAWEWGVTLFAADPLAFKKIVTDMRFDEVSAQYAEFGDFYVGRVSSARDWITEAL